MPSLCLCYAVHEPYRLRRYTVFDMGQNSAYEDDDHNCDALLHAARACYLPMNDVLMRIIRRHGKAFKLAFSISGTALDQFEQYAPEVLDSFKALADTGCVEFLAETAPHSLAFLYSREEFALQVKQHCARIKQVFGVKPTTFRHTELVYNNDLAAALQALGFKAVLAEGTDHVLGWRSPNWLYQPVSAPGMGLLLRNCQLSADIGRRFSDQSWNQWPLTAEKYASWVHSLADEAEVINIFNDCHSFGLRNPASSGIFEFMEALPDAILAHRDFSFATPAEVVKKRTPVGEIDMPQFMSWDDEGADLTAWLGNDMQKDAIHSLYALTERVRKLDAPDLHRDFERLQTSEHFHYISTKWFANFVPDRPNPFQSPYDAYIAYMNVLADFEMRVGAAEATAAPKKATRTAGRKAAAPATDTAKAKTTGRTASKSKAVAKPAKAESPAADTSRPASRRGSKAKTETVRGR